LALWVACRAAHSPAGKEIRTVEAAAQWFASHALRELGNWRSPSEDMLSNVDLRAQSQVWAELTAAALDLAALAERLAGAEPCLAAEARWLGLLHAAPRWLSLVRGAGPAAAPPSELPAWLANVLVSGSRSLTSPSGCVNEAIALLNALQSGGERQELPPGWPPAGHEAMLSAACDRWLCPSVDAGWVPSLVARLARLERLESSFQSELERQKLAALKELAYGAGHEINNPLANISARAQTLLQDEPDPERRRRLAAINSQAFRAYEMIADMMLFARPPQPQLERLDAGELVSRVVEGVAQSAAEQGTVLVYSAPVAPLIVLADPTQIAVALNALCTNALEALGRGGHLTVALDDQGASNGCQGIRIVVSDDGPGISPEIREHLFDPFFSGREAGRGLGFGLSKCWRIVTAHGGHIDVSDGSAGGAIFTICLPSAGPAPAAQAAG
jgi:signal transduction histidine kinase